MPDNPEPRSPRLFGVAQGDEAWEGEVRRLFADRADRARHPGTDLAGTAISRARRARRRRNVIGLATVVAGTMLATGVLLHDWRGEGTRSGDESEFEVISEGTDEDRTPPADPRPRLAIGRALPVASAADVIGTATTGGLVLTTAGGETLPLGPIREVVSAHRFGEGWAVVSGGWGTARLWWVSTGREPVALLAGMDAIVFGHGQVAWQRGVVLSAASLSGDGQLVGQVDTTAPRGGGRPVGFLHGSVLLERTESTGWDTWRPGQGDYRPTWTDEVVRVYGPLPDGASSVGLVETRAGTEGSCLARLDAELGVDGTSCVTTQELPADGPAAVSPNGQWLLTGGTAPAGSMLVDLPTAFGGQPDQAVTALAEAPVTSTAPVWLGPDRVVFATADSLVQLWPDRLRAGADDAVEQIPLHGATALVITPV
jgi:hypothetical protein